MLCIGSHGCVLVVALRWREADLYRLEERMEGFWMISVVTRSLRREVGLELIVMYA
jgi:hypothetical protein